MKTKLLFCNVLLLCVTFISAQVGIGNTNPQSSLDISSSNQVSPSNIDGILIPRIDAFPSINPTNNQQSMLVYVTGNTSATKGFYYWNNPTTSWIPFGGSDSDWYEEVTTIHPDNINDDIYTQGHVAIGKTTANYPLDIEETGSGRTVANIVLDTGSQNLTSEGVKIENKNSGSGSHYALKNIVSGSGNGNHYGLSNELQNSGAGGSNYGVFNSFSSNSGPTYGLYNDINEPSTSVRKGVYSVFRGGGGGGIYGTHNEIQEMGSGVATAILNEIDTASSSGNVHAIDNLIENGGSGSRTGVRNKIIIGSSSGGAFGTINDISHGSINSNVYGCYNELNGSTTGLQYGVYSSVTDNNAYAGYFVGDVYTTGSYLPSARILKANVNRLSSSINKLMDLKVKTYNYKTGKYDFMNLPTGTQTGFIAEELQKEFPELVKKNTHPKKTNEDGGAENEEVEFIAVNYVGLVPHLVKGMQEQQDIIKGMQDVINRQNEKINTLEKRLLTIEAHHKE